MQLKIWCLKTGECVAVLGSELIDFPNDCLNNEPGCHKAGILDTGIIDRGRNILAIDRLGWLRLWDVSTQVRFLIICLNFR